MYRSNIYIDTSRFNFASNRGTFFELRHPVLAVQVASSGQGAKKRPTSSSDVAFFVPQDRPVAIEGISRLGESIIWVLDGATRDTFSCCRSRRLGVISYLGFHLVVPYSLSSVGFTEMSTGVWNGS